MWKNTLRTASFRGVSFRVSDTSLKGGRRTQKHEYPLRDVPFVEDLGRSGQSHSVRGYVIGQNYHLTRDALIRAAEAAGPGRLVHPTLGEKQVICSDFSMSEKQSDGGMATFDFTFLETNEGGVVARASTAAQVRLAAGALQQAIGAEFAALFSISGQFDTVVDEAVDAFTGFASLMEGLIPLGAVKGASDLLEAIDTLLDDPLSVLDGGDPVAAVLDIAQLFTRATQDPAQAHDALLEAAQYTPRGVAAVNVQAMITLMHGAVLSQIAQNASTTPLASATEASELRDDITALIDREMLRDGIGTEYYDSLLGLLSRISADMTERGASLRPLIEYTTPRSLPALVLAQRLYGDADRAEELILRNAVAHPAFMPVTGAAVAP